MGSVAQPGLVTVPAARSGATPLILAAAREWVQAVQSLLAAGANVNAADHNGRTPLLAALLEDFESEAPSAKHRYAVTEIVRDLLAAGADVHCRDRYGRTPLGCAASLGYVDWVRTFLELGADPCIADWEGHNALSRTAQALSLITRVRYSPWDPDEVGAGSPLRRIDPDPARALHDYELALYGMKSSAELAALLETDQEVRDSLNEIIDLLAARGCPLERAVPYLARVGRLDLLAQASGLNLDAQDHCGETALSEAARDGQVERVRFLLDHGADPNAPGSLGVPLAMCAESRRGLAIVDLLLKAGADVKATDHKGRTALDIARQSDRLGLVERFQRHLTQPPTDDFPAAHSGDVEWFAVDAQGHVAAFWAYERYAPVPELQCTGYNVEKLLDQGWQSETIFDLRGALHLFNHHWYGENRIAINLSDHELYGLRDIGDFDYRTVQEIRLKRLGRALVIVHSLDVVQTALDTGIARLVLQLPAGPPFAVEFADLPRDVAERILRSGQCLCCASLRDWSESEAQTGCDVEKAGLYWYSHCGSEHRHCGLEGPYLRDTAPANPLTVDRLPRLLRSAVERVRFEGLSFLDCPLVQPLEHFPCSSGGYLFSDDGRTLRGKLGQTMNNFEPEHWERRVRDCERRREQALREMAAWPPLRPKDQPLSWDFSLIDQIEDYRAANPVDFRPDLVRVAWQFPSNDVALDVYTQLLREEFETEPDCAGCASSFTTFMTRESDHAKRIASWRSESAPAAFPNPECCSSERCCDARMRICDACSMTSARCALDGRRSSMVEFRPTCSAN